MPERAITHIAPRYQRFRTGLQNNTSPNMVRQNTPDKWSSQVFPYRTGRSNKLFLIKLLYFALGYPRITTPRIHLIIIPRLNSYNSLSLPSLVLTSFYARPSKNLANSFSLSRDESHSVAIVLDFCLELFSSFYPRTYTSNPNFICTCLE